MERKRCDILFIMVVLGNTQTLFAQDLSSISTQKPFTYNGVFNVNQNAAFRSTAYTTASPYSLMVSGSASMSIYGVALPFSFTYSNQNISYSQPFSFNQLGMQPSYKWVKAYIGYNTITISPYSLNGHQLLGGGVEVAPPSLGLRVSLMYGRLVKAVEWDSTNLASRPFYQRNGFAAKIGLSTNSGEYNISVFNALDKKNSISSPPDSLGINPQNNMIYTVSINEMLFKKIKVSGLFAGSALTKDIGQSQNSNVNSKELFFLLHSNSTTNYSYAFKGSTDYIGNSFAFGISFERIQSNYNTLGSYYSNNDLENIALTYSKHFFEGKLNFSGSAGSQRNNLDKSKLTTSNQLLGNLNISYTPSQKISINTSYSNYTFFTYIRTPFDQINTTDPYKNLDTLNFTQISQSASINGSIILNSLDDKIKRSMIILNLSYQQAANRQDGLGILNSSYFYQGNIAYSHTKTPTNLSITSSLLFSYNFLSSVQNQIIAGPILGICKSFFDKKLYTNTSIAYNLTMNNSKRNGDVYSIRFGGGYTYLKTHRIALNLALVMKNSKKDMLNQPRAIEFTGSLNYTYTFDKR